LENNDENRKIVKLFEESLELLEAGNTVDAIKGLQACFAEHKDKVSEKFIEKILNKKE
jgi:hypothetical protein